MPGYGVLPAEQGSGLLPWSWALTRLRDSHDYWVSTVWPDGRPHTMPVWGWWDGARLWFSSAPGSRKVRNIAAGSAVCLATADPRNPLVVEGTAELVVDEALVRAFVDGLNAKYETTDPVEFYTANAVVAVRPVWAFGVADGDFAGSPTRWEFAAQA